jgi:hypothetical protein
MQRKSFQIKKNPFTLSRATFYSHNWKSISYRDVQSILAGRMFENFEMEKTNLHCFKAFIFSKELFIRFMSIKSVINFCCFRKRMGDFMTNGSD